MPQPDLSPLGAPLPRRLACVTVDAGPHRCRLAFFLYIVAAISDEGPGMAIGHHVGPKVAVQIETWRLLHPAPTGLGEAY